MTQLYSITITRCRILLIVLFLPTFTPAVCQSVNLDFAILQKMERGRTPGKTKLMRIVSDANMYVNIGTPLALLIAGGVRHDKEMRQNALYVATSTASTILLTAVIKNLVKRPRPFQAHLTFKAVYQPSQFSFPSGHTSSAFSTATALSMAYPKWFVIAPSLLFASSVGVSRMYLGVHYPSDVLVGAALGSGVATGFRFMKK